MYNIIFLLILALIWIIVATFQDLKKREVANWLNFSLIIFALGFRFFYCLFSSDVGGSLGQFSFFYQGLIGLGIFFVLGNLLYYGRIFAGGDAKLMIALGSILPLSESFFTNLQLFLLFFVIFLFCGAFYGLVWSGVLAIKNCEKFKSGFLKKIKKNKRFIYPVMVFGLIFMVFGFVEKMFFISGILIFILPYFYIYAKVVEEVCMIKKIKVEELQEGDWLYEDLKIGRKIIKARWEGLNKEEIKMIQSKKKQVFIKLGIPFVPVFLISFLLFVYIWFSGIEVF